MKKFAKILTMAACFSLAVAAGGRADAVQDARNAYAKGDYEAAARSFQTAIASQGPSAELYYNLAMAQVKAGERPAAALSLRRALMIDPHLADARVSLSEIERSQGVPVQGDDWRAQVHTRVPLPSLLVAGAVTFWLGAFWLLAGVVRGKRRAGPVVLAILLVLGGGGLAGAAAFADPKMSERDAGVILGGSEVTVLSAPADSSEVVMKLPPASPVKILGRSGEWTYCKTATGEKGWLPTSSVEKVVPEP